MRVIAVVLALWMVLPAPARADTPPWAVGVSESQKTKAQKLLDEGNSRFLDRKYSDALDSYRAAVAVWDHPAIRFNMVRCLIQLDREVEAYDDLERSLKYGAAPLEEAVYAEALAFQKLLASRIGNVAIECKQDDVVLTLDGKPLGTCPARTAQRVLSGRHQLVGTKDGFVPRTVDIVVAGGDQQTVKVELVSLAAGGQIRHRFRTWIPWAVFGGGVVIGGLGALLELKAQSDMRAYDRDVALQCPTGCAPGTVSDSLKSTAELEDKIAITIIAVGVATAATGAVLMYMNRGQTVYPDSQGETAKPALGVVPLVGGAGITLSGRF